MGVRGRMYLAAGGFPDVAVDEDVQLADSIRRLGGRVVSTRASPVLTSARARCRAAAPAGVVTNRRPCRPKGGPSAAAARPARPGSPSRPARRPARPGP
jgi:hypothetical protein